MDAPAGPWSCDTCKFVNLHSVQRCMQCGVAKDEQPFFCSVACEQEHQRQVADNANGEPTGDSWLDRFNSACFLGPSYAHSFHAAVWFDSANEPCVSCPHDGSTIHLRPNMMAHIHEEIAKQRQSGRNSAKATAKATQEEERQRSAETQAAPHVSPAASAAPATIERSASPKHPSPTRLVPLVQPRINGASSSDERKEDKPASVAEPTAVCDFVVQLAPIAASAPVEATIKSPDLHLPVFHSAPVTRPSTPVPFSSAEASTCSSPSDDEQSPAALPSPNLKSPSTQAASRLAHPLFVQTTQLTQTQTILPSPPSPSTFTQDQDRLLRESHPTASEPWDGQLHCVQCGRSFAFTELQ